MGKESFTARTQGKDGFVEVVGFEFLCFEFF